MLICRVIGAIGRRPQPEIPVQMLGNRGRFLGPMTVAPVLIAPGMDLPDISNKLFLLQTAAISVDSINLLFEMSQYSENGIEIRSLIIEHDLHGLVIPP